MLSFVNMIENVNVHNEIIQLLVHTRDLIKIKLLNIYMEKFGLITFKNVVIYKKT